MNEEQYQRDGEKSIRGDHWPMLRAHLGIEERDLACLLRQDGDLPPESVCRDWFFHLLSDVALSRGHILVLIDVINRGIENGNLELDDREKSVFMGASAMLFERDITAENAREAAQEIMEDWK
jgi:hypothetical protein